MEWSGPMHRLERDDTKTNVGAPDCAMRRLVEPVSVFFFQLYFPAVLDDAAVIFPTNTFDEDWLGCRGCRRGVMPVAAG